MCYERYTLAESGDEGSRCGEGQRDPEMLRGSWYTTLKGAQDTKSLAIKAVHSFFHGGKLTLAEKLTSLIMRFLLHLSS